MVLLCVHRARRCLLYTSIIDAGQAVVAEEAFAHGVDILLVVDREKLPLADGLDGGDGGGRALLLILIELSNYNLIYFFLYL